MAKISTYGIDASPTLNDKVIGTRVEDNNNTYNYTIGDILSLVTITGQFVPYVNAIDDVVLGSYNITANAIIKAGGTSAQFLKADGSVDNNTYVTTGTALGYVPYTGATTNVNLGTHSLQSPLLITDIISPIGTTLGTQYLGNPAGLLMDFVNSGYIYGDTNVGFYMNYDNGYTFTTFQDNPLGLLMDFNNSIYILGDGAEINNGTYLVVSDGITQTLTTIHQGYNKGLNLNFTANEYQFGDPINNSIIVDNQYNVIYTQSNADLIGLELYFPNREFVLGDPNTIYNGTYLKVDDTNQRVEISKALYTSGDTGTTGQILVSQGAALAPQWTSPAVLYSATFFDTTTQNNGGATVANQVLINSIQAANGFTLGPNNRINVTNAGTYFFSTSMQLTFTGGASNYNVTVWYTINDVIVPNSAFTFTTTGAQNDQTLAVITDTIALTAGQYLKFYWWSAATGMKLLATAAGTSPTRPLSPSVNVSIFNVS